MSLLSVEQWRQEIQYHPWHFWGLANSGLAKVRSNCNSVVKKYAWQTVDAMGRVDIENAITTAEERLLPHLQFHPAPKWIEETISLPRYPKPDIFRLGFADSTGRWLPINTKYKKIIAAGYPTNVLIDSPRVVYSDDDADGLYEKFTATCATTVTDPAKIKVFFSTIDRFDGDVYVDRWEVKPVRISISGGVATITGGAWLLVRPILYEGVTQMDENIDPLDFTNYVSTIDVVHSYIDPDGITFTNAQATLVWESSPFPYWSSSPPGTLDPAGVAYALARVGIRDAENGILSISEAARDSVTGDWYGIPWYDSSMRFRPPDRVIVRYQSGVALDNGKMSSEMASIVTKLAAAESSRRICACDEANRSLYHWQFDLARTGGVNGEAYGAISSGDLSNPLGTRRGQVFAWKEIKMRRKFTGFSV